MTAIKLSALLLGAALGTLSVATGQESHPRDVRTETDLEAACHPPPRPSEALRLIKRRMLEEMGVRSGRYFELDHRIPRCMGGSDDPSNLWLQRCDGWDGYRCVAGPAALKDGEERKKCREVCEEHTENLPGTQQFFRAWKDQ